MTSVEPQEEIFSLKKYFHMVFRSSISKHLFITAIFTFIIFFFSLFMIGVANIRNNISGANYDRTTRIYNGELNQKAPLLNEISQNSAYLKDIAGGYTTEQLMKFAQNSHIVSTDASVQLFADFVKKGLEYQPTYKTKFNATYILQNSLDEEALLSFEFPFPFNTNNNEISNVKLSVNGEEMKNPKSKITVATSEFGTKETDGLKWEGTIPAKEKAVIKVSYDTVGIARFNYEGFENKTGSQDFKLNLVIIGTRSYDINNGLSVDKRIFSDKKVTLVWDKKNLFSTPSVDVSVADKTPPSNKVSRVYVAMSPLYLLFIGILLAIGLKYKKLITMKDLIIVSVLYIMYFPLLHYFTSFTIDPTMEIFANIPQIGYFSLPLYVAFAFAFVIIVGLITYLFSFVYGVSYTMRSVLPISFLCLGFFPLAITIPEYSILLVLLGLVGLIFTWIQNRLREN